MRFFALFSTLKIEYCFNREVAEWSKAHAWKVCRRGTVSRVRIPFSPPLWNPSGHASHRRLPHLASNKRP